MTVTRNGIGTETGTLTENNIYPRARVLTEYGTENDTRLGLGLRVD